MREKLHVEDNDQQHRDGVSPGEDGSDEYSRVVISGEKVERARREESKSIKLKLKNVFDEGTVNKTVEFKFSQFRKKLKLELSTSNFEKIKSNGQ